MFWFPLCLLTMFELYIVTQGLVKELGPADMKFQRFVGCDENENYEVDLCITSKNVNRTHTLLQITLNTDIPIDDMTTIELNGSMKKEGGYKPGCLYYKDIACKVVEKILGENMWSKLLQAASVEKCPIPVGKHVVESFYFDNNEFTVPQIWGEYRTDITIFNGEEEKVVNKCAFYYEMIEKESEK